MRAHKDALDSSVWIKHKKLPPKGWMETPPAPCWSQGMANRRQAEKGGISAPTLPLQEVLSMFKGGRLRLLKNWLLDALFRFPRSDGVCCVHDGPSRASAQKSKLNKFVETYCKCFKEQILLMHTIIKMLRRMYCLLFKSPSGFIHVF